MVHVARLLVVVGRYSAGAIVVLSSYNSQVTLALGGQEKGLG